MAANVEIPLISKRYHEVFGAQLSPGFASYMVCATNNETSAALGYRRAGAHPLFLETYLDEPVETAVSRTYGRTIAREAVIEIGNFASDNAMAMVALWGSAANDLAGSGEVAVATLTLPLRRMFARIGVPIVELAPARPERLGEGAADWGSYYETDPRVCAGLIAEGQDAIAAFLARRQNRKAA